MNLNSSLSSDSTDLGFSIFSDVDRARSAAANEGVDLYRSTVTAEPQWACVVRPSAQVAEGGARQHAEGTIAYQGGRVDGGDARFMVVLWFDAPAPEAQGFEAWFRDEHGPMLLEEPTWLSSRQVKLASTTISATHLVLHELADMSALSSDALVAARATPARQALAAQHWFASSLTQVFERAEPAT